MKKLETAIIYLQRIADGNNPVNNMPAEDDSVLNNPNVIRCMYFVKEVLEEVHKNGGLIGSKPKRRSGRAEDMFPFEVLEKFRYAEDKGVNKLLTQIYEPAEDKTIRKLSGKTVNEWFMAAGYVKEVFNEEVQKNIKVPTDKGIALGLRGERVQYQNRVYYTIIYNKNAQEFLVRNMEKFINGEVVE